MKSELLTQASSLAAGLAAMPVHTVDHEREQTIALCSIVRILADACSGECGTFIDLASDLEAQIERERESEMIGEAA